MMTVSVTQPLSSAFEHTKRVLFQPFSFSKWLVMGFAAFLMQLGGGGVNFNCSMPNFNTPPPPQQQLPPGTGGGPAAPSAPPNVWQEITQFFGQYPWALPVAVLLALGVVALMLVFFWLGARGKMIFIDCLATNQAAIVEPWKRLAVLGNSLFKARLALMGVTLAVAVVVGGPMVAVFASGAPNATKAITAILGGVVLIAAVLAVFLAGFVLDLLVAPVMYAQGVTVIPAWRAAREEIILGRGWMMAGYLGFTFVLGIAAQVVTVLACCATCLLAILPYIGSVVMLPVTATLTGYSLYFVQQFGPQFNIIRGDDGGLLCHECGYDLRGNPEAATCPECGAPLLPPDEPLLNPPTDLA